MIVIIRKAEHAFASVTVHVHDPAVSPETLAVPSPIGFPGVQLYASVPVPPEAETEAVPLFPLLQETFVCDTVLTTIAVGCVIVNVLDAEQRFASVTVQV